MIQNSISNDIANFFTEDDLQRNPYYISKLPEDIVKCKLKFKDDLTVSGLPWFIEAFNYLGASLDYKDFKEYEGSKILKKNKTEVTFDLPFNIALTGERIALNLLQHSSSIATFTNLFVEKAKAKKIKILDTRKTTPGLRALEKYSVRTGGGFNHRLGQTDMWMVKDNHKSFFGGVEQAINFFKDQGSFYNPIELEVHDLDELIEAQELNIKHVMLDNFSPEDIRKAVSVKNESMTYEVSGGVNLENLESYLIDGVDAISVGKLTYGAPPVDISLKYEKKV
ncbi:carboxylating nicotinate-nucleotide diphosphorylase [Bacteriovoracaceae bacterium]|nr:carboxylating nicotinate-nucleotide diphosphorylase [Bacteriovoracaceae bacterium]